jgi:hypothetical protein
MSAIAIEAPALRAEEIRAARPPTPVRASRPAWLVLAPGLAIVGLLVLWGADSGGYEPLTWYPSALVAAALLLATFLFLRSELVRPGRAARIALAALALYVAWSYLSISWAASPGDALTGSNRALLYLILFSQFAVLRWERRTLRIALSGFSLGIGVLAVVTIARLAHQPAPELLIDGRLAAPVGYQNATAALGSMAMLMAVALGSDRSRPPLLRAALAASATASLELALLAQSRGWLYTLPILLILFLAGARKRMRLTLSALIPAAAAAATLPWLAHSYSVADSSSGALAETAVARADVATARAALLSIVGAGLAGMLLSWTDRRYAVVPRARATFKRLTRAAVATAAVALLPAGGILLADGALARGWHQFTRDAPSRPGISRFVELGSGRYDFWRVAIGAFVDHPFGGLGQDNFAQAYVASRRTAEEPRWIHSLELRLLAHTGLVGFALFLAFTVAALAAALRSMRTSRWRLNALGVATLMPLAVWLVHGSLDWFWEIPALSGPAIAFLGAATALGARPASPARRRRWAAPLLALAGAAAVAAALLPAYLGERQLARGQALAAANPPAALAALRSAASLEPLSSTPGLLAAAIELGAGDARGASGSLAQALRRDPENWLGWLERGLEEGASGNLAGESSALARAASLDPREPVIAIARSRAATLQPLTIGQAASMFAERVNQRVGR